MSTTLDILTLQSQLAVLAKNATSLDATISEKTIQLQALATEVERLRGARQYHEMLVGQVNALIANAQASQVSPSIAPPPQP